MTVNLIDRLDGVAEGVAIKVPCRVVAIGPISLTGLQVLKGITLADGDRVLVPRQANRANNGIYRASSGNWTRTADFDGARDVVDGTRVYVREGNYYARSTWVVSAADPVIIGTTVIDINVIDDVRYGWLSGYPSLPAAQADAVPAAVNDVTVLRYYDGGELCPARYYRVDSEPATVRGKFRSIDRYMPDGTTDEANGGWWLMGEWMPTVQMFGAKADGIDTMELWSPSKGAWKAGLAYVVGDTVKIDEVRTFRCTTDHTASAKFVDDQTANWRSNDRGAWSIVNNYGVGDLVNDGGPNPYRCIVTHSAGPTLAQGIALGYWTEIKFTGFDNTAAIKDALDFCDAYGIKTLGGYGKTGSYLVADPAIAGLHVTDLGYGIVVPNSEIEFVNLGGARILYDDDLTNHAPFTYFLFVSEGRTDNVPSNVDRYRRRRFEMGWDIKGRWAHGAASGYLKATWDGAKGRGLFALEGYEEIVYNRAKHTDIRGIYSVNRQTHSSLALQCTFERIARGSVMRNIDSDNIYSLGNRYFATDDDVINPISTGNGKPPERLVSIGDDFEQCESFNPLATKLCIIANPKFMFCKSGPLAFGGNSGVGTPGSAPAWANILHNVSMVNSIGRYDSGAGALWDFTAAAPNAGSIAIVGNPRSNATTTAYPGNATGTGVVDPIGLDDIGNLLAFEWFSNSGTPTVSVAAPNGFLASGINIQRNVPMTTAHFSDYGRGPMFHAFGWYDPPVAPKNWVPHGLRVMGDLRNVRITDLNVSGLRTGDAVHFDTLYSNDNNGAFENVVIDGFNIDDCKNGFDSTFSRSGSTQYSWGVTIRNGTINGDPYLKQSIRTSPQDGTYQTGVALADQTVGIGIVRRTKGVKIQNVAIRNVHTPILYVTSLLAECVPTNILLQCDPVAVGAYNAGNKGIAAPHRARPGIIDYEIRYSDPTDTANFNNVKNLCPRSVSSKPTSGTFPAGHFAAYDGGEINLAGYLRLTTGTAHADGTDWHAVWNSPRRITYTDDHTLALADLGNIIVMQKGTAVTLTVPADATLLSGATLTEIPQGTMFGVQQTGAGQVTLAESGSTINSEFGNKKLFTTYSSAAVAKQSSAANTWLASGSLAA